MHKNLYVYERKRILVDGASFVVRVVHSFVITYVIIRFHTFSRSKLQAFLHIKTV